MDKKRGGQPLSDDVMPALFGHCERVYLAMLNEAKALNNTGENLNDEDYDAEPTTIVVYTGKLTKLVAECNLSAPYYSSVTQALRQMGCIRQLSRGGGSADSQWQLIQEPTKGLFQTMKDAGTVPQRKARATKTEGIQSQVNNLNGRVNTLEAELQQLKNALTGGR
jgi:hypothetical protein